MQEQWPTGRLSLFSAFNGYVEHLYLTNVSEELSPYYAIDFRDRGLDESLLNVRFTRINRFDDNSFASKGRVEQRLRVSNSSQMQFKDVFF